jgi:hypothetical protein
MVPPPLPVTPVPVVPVAIEVVGAPPLEGQRSHPPPVPVTLLPHAAVSMVPIAHAPSPRTYAAFMIVASGPRR